MNCRGKGKLGVGASIQGYEAAERKCKGERRPGIALEGRNGHKDIKMPVPPWASETEQMKVGKLKDPTQPRGENGD